MDEENIKGKMESSEAPALTVMDQEPVNTKVVNATVKATDLPSWLELLRDVMKGHEREGLNTTKIANILVEKYPDEFNSIKLRAELSALLKEGLKYGICVKQGANWLLSEDNLTKNIQGCSLFAQSPTYRRQRKGRIGRPRKSDVVSVSIDMHDLEKDLNYSKTKTPTISDGTKKDPSSLPSSTPDKVSVEAEKGLFTQNGWLRAPHASALIGSRVRVIRALARYVCDGQVDAYLPPHVNEGIALWQVKHDNGDRSIVTLAAVQQFQLYLQNDSDLKDSVTLESLTEKDVCTMTPTGEVVQSPPSTLSTTTAIHTSAAPSSTTADAVACYYQGDRFHAFLRAFPSIQSAVEDCHLRSCEAIKSECDEGRSTHSASKIFFQWYAEDNKSKLHHNPNYQVEKEVIRYLLTSASNSSSSGTGSNASSKSTLLKRATNCIACSSMNGILLQIFTSTEDAASALGIPIAGILLALSYRSSSKKDGDVCEEAAPSFAGLQWAYVSKDSQRSRHFTELPPVEVIRAMIAVSCTGLSLCKQPKMKMETTNKHKKLLHEASKPKQIPTSYVSEKIDCSTLDGVLLHTFDSLSDIRAELGLQDRGLLIMACCQGMLPYCHGFKWRFSLGNIPSANATTTNIINIATTVTITATASATSNMAINDMLELTKLLNDIEQLDELLTKDDEQALIQAGGGGLSLQHSYSITGNNFSSINSSSGGGGTVCLTNSYSSGSSSSSSSSTANVINSSSTANVINSSSIFNSSGASKVIAVAPKSQAPASTVVHVPGRSMLSLNIKALQNICVKRLDPNFSAKRFVKAPAIDSAEEEKPDDISQTTVSSVDKHAAMRAEGWLFSTTDNEFIGMRLRRFFPSNILSEGTIEAYLPFELNDSVPLWHVRYDDGDREDVDLLPMLKYLLFLREGYHYDPEEVELKKEKDSGKSTTVHVSDVKEKDSSSTLLQAVEGSSAEMDQSTVKFEDENIEDALTDIVEQMQIDFRKMRGFKGTFPNLAAIVLYCLKTYSRRCKTSVGEINAGLNINEISRYLSIILESRGHQEVKFLKSLLFVIGKLTNSKKLTKHNESCCRQEVYYTCVDLPNLMAAPTIFTALDSDLNTCDDKEDDPGSRPVDCLSLSDNFLLSFKNVDDAAISLGIGRDLILQMCRGQKSSFNLKFRFSSKTSGEIYDSSSIPVEEEYERRFKIDQIKRFVLRHGQQGRLLVDKEKCKDGVKFMVSPRNSFARSGSIRELILSANNFAVIPDLIAPASHISPEQMSANDDIHTYTSKSADTPKKSTPLPPPPPLIFSPTITVLPDDADYDKCFAKYLKLCLFMSTARGAILPISSESPHGDENYFESKKVKEEEESSDIESIAEVNSTLHSGDEAFDEAKLRVPVAETKVLSTSSKTEESKSLKYVCVLSKINHHDRYKEILESDWLASDLSTDITDTFEVFDGKGTFVVNLDRFVSCSDDLFESALRIFNGDVPVALRKIKQTFEELRTKQWTVKDLSLFLGAMKSFSGDMHQILRSLRTSSHAYHTPVRSAKEIVLLRQTLTKITGDDHDEDHMQNIHNKEKMKQFINVLKCAEQFTVQEKKLKPGIEITHQLLSGLVDSTGKVFSVEKFEPIEVKHAISNTTSTDTGGGKVNRKAKPVEMVDCATNKLMRVYASGSDAAEHMGLYQSAISLCARGLKQSYAGYRWNFYTGPDINFEGRIYKIMEETESAPPPPEKKRRSRKRKSEALQSESEDGSSSDVSLSKGEPSAEDM